MQWILGDISFRDNLNLSEIGLIVRLPYTDNAVS